MNTFKRIATSLMVFFVMSSAFSYSKKDLYNAVRATNESHVKKILMVSPDLSTLKYDSENNSILMVAIQYGCNDKIIDHILKAGCSPDFKNKSGQTAVMYACNFGVSKKTLKRLIEFNAFTKAGKIRRITLKDKHGRSAFDYCGDHKDLYALLSTYTIDPATIKTEPDAKMPVPEPEPEPEVEEEIEQETETVEEPEVQNEVETEPETVEEQEEVPVEEIQEEPEDIVEEPAPVEEPEVELEPVIDSPAPEVEPEPEAVPVEEESQEEEPVPEVEEEQAVEPEEEPEVQAEQEEIEVVPEPEPEEEASEVEEEQAVEPEEEPEIQVEQETPAEAEITASIEIPQIDYYNSRRPEYLFDEIDTESLIDDNDEEESLNDIRETKVRIIQNPDALDNVGRTRLMNAIMENDERLCFILLESGANPNAKDKDGWTPLMYACRYSQSSTVIQLLFEYGAKLDAKSNYQVSVLQIAAAYSKNRKVLAAVLEQASNLKMNLQDSFIAALKEERPEEFIREYLKYNLNLNTMYKGKTPLMYAAEYYESTDVIKLLLENGADPYIISSEKKNAFSYAKDNSKIVHDSVYWSLNVSSSKKR